MKKILSIIFVTLLIISLSSCTPDSLEKCKKRFERRGYMVEYTETILSSDSLIGTISCGKGMIPSLEQEGSRHFIGSLYETEEKAIEALNKINDEFQETDYKRYGNWVILADEKSLRIFK